MSHKSEAVVTKIIKQLEEEFGEMSKTRGNKHDFVHMDITFEQDSTVKIVMKDYLQNA